MGELGQMGLVLALGLGTVGSALGIGLVGQAAAGAWAKEGKAGKRLNFTYIILHAHVTDTVCDDPHAPHVDIIV